MTRAVALILLVAWLSLPVRSENPVALVTDLSGGVTLAGQPGELLQSVPSGTVVELAPESRLRLSFAQGGLRVWLEGPGKARVEDAGVVPLEQAPRIEVTRPPSGTALKLPPGLNLDRMAGVRRGELAWTADPVSITPRPELTWNAPDGFEQFEVLIEEEGTYRRVHKQLVSGRDRRLELPAGMELEAGKVYLLSLTGFRPDGSRFPAELQPQRLQVLTGAQRESLEKARTEALTAFASNPSDLTPVSLMTGLYLDQELRGPARALLDEVGALRPGDAALRALRERMDR